MTGIVCSLLGAVLVSTKSEFRFDSNNGVVTWDRHGMFASESGGLSIDQVYDAVVETNIDEGGITTRRVSLITADGRIPLTKSYSGIDNCTKVAKQIRAWLITCDPAESLSVPSPDEATS